MVCRILKPYTVNGTVHHVPLYTIYYVAYDYILYTIYLILDTVHYTIYDIQYAVYVVFWATRLARNTWCKVELVIPATLQSTAPERL